MVAKTRKNRTSESNSSGATFQLKASGKQFMFNLKAPNGEIILTSERYKSKTSAKIGIRSVKANAGNSARFDRRQSKSDEPYFVLKARNGEIIGTSEMYESTGGMENGIQSVKDNRNSDTEDVS